MNEPANESYDFFSGLKKAEPLGVLASLSLVITTFTYKELTFAPIYGDSVIATFMFIIAFVAALILPMPAVKDDKFYYRMTTYAVYFFSAIGIIHLLFIAYEFGKQANQVFSFASGWLVSFLGGSSIFAAIRGLRSDYDTQRASDQIIQILFFALLVAFGASTLILAADQLIVGFTGFATGVSKNDLVFIAMGSLSSIGLLKTFESFYKKRGPQKRAPI